MRIGTWNVEYALKAGSNLRRRKVLERHKADIWVLTETRDTLRPLGQFQPAHSRQRPYYGKSVKLRSRWVSIWSRFPIIARPRCDDPERTTAAIVRSPLGNVLIYGTVMPWKDDKGRCGELKDAKGWTEHHRVLPLQIAEWKRLANRYAATRICVAGDFNTDMGTGFYYGTKQGIALVENGLCSVRCHCLTAPNRTFRTKLANLPIDHIAGPRTWAPRCRVVASWEGRIGRPRLSDHSGLVVEVTK
jgi:hypothetical protein